MTHSLNQWYRVYRAQGETAQRAAYYARLSQRSERENEQALARLSLSSRRRIERFVHEFIRSADVDAVRDSNTSDFINDPERAGRCYDADGSTHAEVIGDWREAFATFISERRRGKWSADPDRFEAAVRADFTATELWHEFHGSLDQEIG